MQASINKTSVKSLLQMWKRYYIYCRQDIKYFLFNILVITFVIALGASMIWMVGQGIDALQEQQFGKLSDYLVIFTLLVITLQGLRYLNRFLYEWLQQRIIFSIRRQLYSHMLLLSVPFKHVYANGDLLTRLGQDVIRVAGLLVIIPSFLFSHALTFVAYFGILFYIDYQLAALAVILTPLFVLQQRYFTKRTRQASREFLSYQGKMGGFEEESLSNLQGVVSFAAESSMLQRFDRLFAGFRQAAMRHLLLQNTFFITFELLAAMLALLLIGLGVYSIQLGRLSTGDLVNFLLYLGYLIVPLRGLSNIPVESQIRAAAAERIAEILDTQPTVSSVEDPVNLSPMQGSICFEDVDFSYIDGSHVLKKFNLSIAKGEFIALVGPSGAGKSTLAKLLLRFYDPRHGRILIDNTDIRNISLTSLRSQISTVWQQAFLINGTVFENLLLAKPDASEDEMIHALRLAHADEFIAKLDNGYDTIISTHGSKLSAGQVQRIALAQAFLRQARILILDEATSALDSHAEQAVQKAYSSMRGSCTMIVIAHRYATVADADRIIYLNGDGSVDVGTHDDLLQRHSSYRQASIHQRIAS